MSSGTLTRPDDWTTLAPDPSWDKTRARFIEAVSAMQREAVEQALRMPHHGCCGLKAWLHRVASSVCVLPETFPPELIQAYLDNADTMPLHDCENCGLHVPVIPSRQYGYEDEPERILFPTCPHCGGRTGIYLFWGRPRQPK